ncbi:MAG: type II secretion system F family protein, partial [Planctomycetota bacterium]|nr:type II secretion system F family protein [Planctomycetota bacterium]
EMAIEAPVTIPCRYSLCFVGALFAWGLLAACLHSQWLGRRLWWHMPLLGEPFRMDEQAALARNLGLMLDAGATLERAVSEIAAAGAGGPMQHTMARISKALDEGVPPPEAFRAAGRWREEFLWAVDAVSEGVPPRLAFAQVGAVLEDKSASRFDAVYRVCTPLAVLLAAAGVGLLGWTVFNSLAEIARSVML